jgi:hypothetical protein
VPDSLNWKSYSASSIAPAHAVGVQCRKPKPARLQQRLSVLQQRMHRYGTRSECRCRGLQHALL